MKKQVETILAKMTLRENIGQTAILYGDSGSVKKTIKAGGITSYLKKKQVGNLI